MKTAAVLAVVLTSWQPLWPAGPADGSGGRVRYATDRIALEVDPGSLTAEEAAAFVALADRGVADIESLVGPSLPAWAKRTGRIRFIVTRRVGLSRTYGRTVMLPPERVRAGSAPYLHETVHALVPIRGDRVWLSEGLASYLESWVSENLGGYDAHVFTSAGDRGIHAAALRLLASEAGRAVLPWVGGRGQPPLLEDDRRGVARPFYVLSQSLTKHVVSSTGLGPVVESLLSPDDDASLRATGRSDAQWKKDWLFAIGASAQASEDVVIRGCCP